MCGLVTAHCKEIVIHNTHNSTLHRHTRFHPLYKRQLVKTKTHNRLLETTLYINVDGYNPLQQSLNFNIF